MVTGSLKYKVLLFSTDKWAHWVITQQLYNGAITHLSEDSFLLQKAPKMIPCHYICVGKYGEP